MEGLRKTDSGRRVKISKNNKERPEPLWGQLEEDRPDFRKSPFSVLKYTMRFIYGDSYPAKFNRELVNDFILLYTQRGDNVFDPFVGSGESILQAGLLGRKGYGIDVNPNAIKICEDKLKAHKHLMLDEVKFEVGNAMKLNLPDNSQQLVLTSPPFGTSIDAKHIHYSSSPDDLGNSEGYDIFLRDFRVCLKEIYRVTKKDGLAIIEMRDRGKNMFIPLGALTMIELIKIGFEPWGLPVVEWHPYTTWAYGPAKARKFIPCHAHLCIGRKTGKPNIAKFLGLK